MKRILTFAFAVALIATSASAGQHARRASSTTSATTPTRSTITRNYNPAAIRNNNAGLARNNNATFARNSTLQRNWNGSNNVVRSANFNKNGKHHHNHNNHVVFVGSFGYPYWGYGYGSPYYGYGYPYSYSSYPSQYNYNGDAEYGYGYNQDGGGSIVIEVQRHLSREGFYRGTIDGVAGSRTRYAIRAYKRSHGLRADSEIDSQLLGAMGLR